MQTEHLRLVDDVVRRLEESILSGDLQPGDRLLVLPLARQYGISQSTVREALLMLEQRGLVQTRPRRGAFVSRLSAREAFEICQARALLEAYAVSIGAGEIAEETLATLGRVISAVAHCALPRDLPRVIQADRDFHAGIMALAGSPTLTAVWAALNGRMGALIMRTQAERQMVMADFVRYHMEVVDALASRNPQRARTEVVRHYLRGFETVPAILTALPAAVDSLLPGTRTAATSNA
jgi:DNA-binding GntR family transcriptional regulator